MSRTCKKDDRSKAKTRSLNRRNLLLGDTTVVAAAYLLRALETAGLAQQTTGTPGSAGATATIDGKYLPPPPKFGGEINLGASQSKPYWPAQVVPPTGAPNVSLIMTDDQGYGVSGIFVSTTEPASTIFEGQPLRCPHEGQFGYPMAPRSTTSRGCAKRRPEALGAPPDL